MSEYERKRAELIERNRQRLLALGLAQALGEATAAAAAPEAPKAPARKRKVAAARAAGEEGGGERRQSRRLRAKAQAADGGGGGAGAEKGEGEEALVELVDEPRRASTSTNRSGRTWEERIAELELSGLVGCDEAAAEFIVIGSTGTPYTITLTDERRRCQCVDHRIRKRDCKHIRCDDHPPAPLARSPAASASSSASLMRSLAHSLAHSLTHSLTHSLAHSLVQAHPAADRVDADDGGGPARVVPRHQQDGREPRPSRALSPPGAEQAGGGLLL